MLFQKFKKFILFFLLPLLLAVLSLPSITKAEDNYLIIQNNTNYDIYAELKMEQVDSHWYCPMSSRASGNARQFQPVPKNDSRTATWKCDHPMEVKFKFKDGKYSDPINISTYLETSFRLHLENDTQGADILVTREDIKPTSPSFPYYQLRVTISELKSYEYKPRKRIAEPTRYLETGVKKVTVTNDTERSLWIAFKDNDTDHQDRINLGPKATGSTKPSKYAYASSGGIFYLGCCDAQSDEELVFYGRPINVTFEKRTRKYVEFYSFDVVFTYDSASGEAKAKITDKTPKDNRDEL